jgi:ankyrin repeat protein
MEQHARERLKAALTGSDEDEVVAALQGFDVNANVTDDQTALIFAVSKFKTRFVEILLQHGADPNGRPDGPFGKRDSEPIDFARQFEDVRLLIQAGANKDRVPPNGGLPLLVGQCVLNFRDSARFLIEAGADVNIKGTNSAGWPPIIAALGMPDIVQLLLDHGANPNDTSSDGNTPLHYIYSPVVAKILLDGGADPSLRNNLGEQPLHRAVRVHNPPVTEATIRILYDRTPDPHDPPINHPVYNRIAAIYAEMVLRNFRGTQGRVTNKVLGFLGMEQPRRRRDSES